MRGPTILLALSGLCCAACDAELALAPVAPGVEVIYGQPAETVLTPFPSNRYAVHDPASTTGLRVWIQPEGTQDLLVSAGNEITLAELNALDGFSNTGGVIVSFTGPIATAGLVVDPEADPSTAPPVADALDYRRADSPLLLVNVDESSTERGRTHGLVPRWWEQPADGYYLNDEFTLIAQPAEPLLPATRYLFAVTDRLHARDGGPVRRSPDMDALLRGRRSDAYAAEVARGLDELEAALDVDRTEVALATVFTTASVHDGIVAMAKQARRGAPPRLIEPWTVERPLGADGRMRLRAVFEAPDYRTPWPDGRWVVEAGEPVVQSMAEIEVFLAVADATSHEPRPVVIYGHGLGGDKDGCWGTAERLASLNAAVVSIDSPHHGARAEDPEDSVQAIFRFFGIDLDDQSFVIGRARDNFRQMASDQLQLVRLIRSLGALDLLPFEQPDGFPDLDTSRILYIGHSFGAVQGPTVFALAPEISHAVWNVGGAGLMTLLRDSSTFSVLVNGMRPPGVADGAIARFFAVTQAIIDSGDPLNYARFGTQQALPGVPNWRPREVLMQEVIADNIVPNSTSRAVARAAGLPLLDPIDPISGLPVVAGPVRANLPTGVTGAISQFDRMNGGELATHGELIFSPEAKAQYLEFFRTGLADAHATIPSPY